MGIKRTFTRPARWNYGLATSLLHNTNNLAWDTALDIRGRGTAYIYWRPWPAAVRNQYIQITVDGTVVITGDALTGYEGGLYWVVDFNVSLKIEHKVANVVDDNYVYAAYYYHGV